MNTKNKAAALDIQQNQINTQSGEMGIQAQTKQETQLAIQKLHNNKAAGIDGISAELLKNVAEEEVINNI
jgi:hypothetical protein